MFVGAASAANSIAINGPLQDKKLSQNIQQNGEELVKVIVTVNPKLMNWFGSETCLVWISPLQIATLETSHTQQPVKNHKIS